MSVVGFDLGNESCVIAVARRRVIDVLQNLSGHRKTPTMVAFQGKQRFLGDDAAAQWMNNYKNTVRSLKRVIGCQFDDPDLQQELPYLPNKLVKLPDGKIGFQINYNDEQQTFTTEQLVAALFQKLKQITEIRLDGQRVSDCVIACPPYWDDSQRRAIMDAANIAGLNVLRLLNENTAVALNYGILRTLPEKDPIKVMFVDVGHASTIVSVVSFIAGKLQVLSVVSDRNLGARNFDGVLVQHFAKYVKTKYNLDVLSDVKASLKLLKECERIKTVLSANVKVPFSIEYLLNDVDVSGSIERTEFEALSEGLLKQLLSPVEKALELAKVKKEELFAVEVVGGGVRIPAVSRVLKEYVGREVSRTCDGDESVARGCALMCAMLSPNVVVRQFEVQDSTPFAIDVAWGPAPKDANTPADIEDNALLFKLYDAIPSVKLISFKERPAFQLTARYARPELISSGTSDPTIARFVISGMPPTAPVDQIGAGKIKVKVKLDMNNLVSITSAQLLQDVRVEIPDPPKDVPMGDAAAKPEEPKKDEAGAAKPEEPKKEEPKKEEAKSPMDEDAEDDKDKSADAGKTQTDASGKKFKTNTIRTSLKVDALYTWGLDKKRLESFYEKEVAMAEQDRSIAETNERRNELESYVLEMRNAVQGGHLADYVEDADRDKLVQAFDQMESWLYDGGLDAQKSEYIAKLKGLKEQGDPVSRRKLEHENREQCVAALKSTIGKLQGLATSSDEKYAHIEQADRDKVLAEVAAADQWLADVLSKQDHVVRSSKKPLAANPAVLCAELQAKAQHLESVCIPIMNKPKPAPKPEPKPEPPKAEPADPNAAPKEAPMDASKEPTPSSSPQPNSPKMDLD